MKYIFTFLWLLIFVLLNLGIVVQEKWLDLGLVNIIMAGFAYIIYLSYFNKTEKSSLKVWCTFFGMISLGTGILGIAYLDYLYLSASMSECQGERYCLNWLVQILGPHFYWLISVIYFGISTLMFFLTKGLWVASKYTKTDIGVKNS